MRSLQKSRTLSISLSVTAAEMRDLSVCHAETG